MKKTANTIFCLLGSCVSPNRLKSVTLLFFCIVSLDGWKPWVRKKSAKMKKKKKTLEVNTTVGGQIHKLDQGTATFQWVIIYLLCATLTRRK